MATQWQDCRHRVDYTAPWWDPSTSSSSPTKQAQLSWDFFVLMEGPQGLVFCFINHNLKFMSREKVREQLRECVKLLCEKVFVAWPLLFCSSAGNSSIALSPEVTSPKQTQLQCWHHTKTWFFSTGLNYSPGAKREGQEEDEEDTLLQLKVFLV